MKERFKEIEWNSGASEAISFVILFPIILIVIFAVIGYSEWASTRQRIEYLNYMAARTAAVSSTLVNAQTNSAKYYRDNFPSNRVSYLTGLPNETTVVRCDEDGTIPITPIKTWRKGDFFLHTSYYYYDSFVPFSTVKMMSTNIIMMAENQIVWSKEE